MITRLAELYLASLKRVDIVPIDAVRTLAAKQGIALTEPLIQFHERFAGYTEQMGRDVAVWGLVHARPQWLTPYTLEVFDAGEVLMACADAHPSYDYTLTMSGEFVGSGAGGPCESFEVKVERNAEVWRVMNSGGRLDLEQSTMPHSAQLAWIENQHLDMVPAASDKNAQCLANAQWLVLRHDNGSCTVWRR